MHEYVTVEASRVLATCGIVSDVVQEQQGQERYDGCTLADLLVSVQITFVVYCIHCCGMPALAASQ